MTDILKKLYAVPETGADPDLIDEVAAEIERLRAELDAVLEMIRDKDDRYGIGNMCSQWTGEDIVEDILERVRRRNHD